MFFLRNGFGIEILINMVLPWLIYMEAQPALGRVHALMVSALPPLAWSAVQLAVKKRLDALSILVIAGIVLSLAAFFGGGSFRMLELREHLVTGLIGLVFVGSVMIGWPLLDVLLRAMMQGKSQADAAVLARRLENRRQVRGLTLAIGSLLLLQTMVAISLVFTLPVRQFLIVSPLLSYALLGMFVGAVLYLRYRARTVQVERVRVPSDGEPRDP
jgi:hypothetical protein